MLIFEYVRAVYIGEAGTRLATPSETHLNYLPRSYARMYAHQKTQFKAIISDCLK